MKKFEMLGVKLTRSQIKKVNGGNIGKSICYNDTTVCYTGSDGTQYRCFTVYEGEQESACCCQHDSGNHNCHD